MTSPAVNSAAPAQPANGAPAPTSVEAICNGLRGRYNISSNTFIILSGTDKGKEVGPSVFERLAGREASKKWKSSVKVYHEETGKTGKSIGDWLAANGYDQGNAFRRSTSPRQARDTTKADQSKQSTSKDLYNPFTNNRFLGLCAPDPTAPPLPLSLSSLPLNPSIQNPIRQTFDLAQLSHQELMTLAAQTHTQQPFSDLFPKDLQPGVFADRLAQITGQVAKRPRATQAQQPRKTPKQGSGSGSAALSRPPKNPNTPRDAPAAAPAHAPDRITTMLGRSHSPATACAERLPHPPPALSLTSNRLAQPIGHLDSETSNKHATAAAKLEPQILPRGWPRGLHTSSSYDPVLYAAQEELLCRHEARQCLGGTSALWKA